MLEVSLDQPLDFEDLTIQVLSCWQPSAKLITPESRVLLDVKSSLPQKQSKLGVEKSFYGWILANSPASSYIPHPKFDISLLECKNKIKIAEPKIDSGAQATMSSTKAPN